MATTTPKAVPRKLTVVQQLIAAAENGADGVSIQAIIDMHVQQKLDMQRDAWHDAMRACQSDMAPISKDATNPQTRSKYVSLPLLDAALRPIYLKHGFDVTFNTDPADADTRRVLLQITHEAGWSECFSVDMPVSTIGIRGTAMMTLTHAAASALTYGRRYLLCLAFNIATEDDDGNAASPKPTNKPPVQEPEKLIDDAKVQSLITECNETGADIRLLCFFLSKKWGLDVKTLGDIPESKFIEVRTMLEKKRGQGK